MGIKREEITGLEHIIKHWPSRECTWNNENTHNLWNLMKHSSAYPLLHSLLYHDEGRTSHSDWYENSFVMVVYEKLFLMFSQNFLSKTWVKKIFLIDNHYKTILVSVRIECSSPTVCTCWYLCITGTSTRCYSR